MSFETLVAQVGFNGALVFYLLFIFGKKLDKNTEIMSVMIAYLKNRR